MAVSIKKVEKWAQKKKVSKLLKVLPDVDAETRIAILKALGTTNDEKAMYTLINYLREPDASIRYTAVEALGIMGNGRALEFVRQLWNNETDKTVREKAEWALREIKAKLITEEKL